MDTLDKLKELESGKPYTVVGMGEFGFPYQVQIILNEVRVEPYAQYPVSYLLIFRQKGKRLSRQVRFYGTRSVIVWRGWVFPDTEMYRAKETKETSGGPVTIRTGFPCFDDRYMQIARESVADEPMIECYKRPEVCCSE